MATNAKKETPSLLMDLISEILSWLPVKILLRFRCVSKSFLSLVDSSEFSKQQLRKSMEMKARLKLICQDDIAAYDKWSYSFPTTISVAEFDNGLQEPFVLLNPVPSLEEVTDIIGSCDGLLLLWVADQALALWNPSTRKYKKLPKIELSWGLYGLGYNCDRDDYEVVRIGLKEGMIYSLKDNAWRRIKDLPFDDANFSNQYIGLNKDFSSQHSGIFADGCLHWMVKSNTGLERIAAFNLSKEKMDLLSPLFYSSEFSVTYLGFLEGNLCLSLKTSMQEEVKVDLYVRKLDATGFNWIKLYTMESGHFPFCIDYVKPMAYSRQDGNKIILNAHDWHIIWYDLEKKTGDFFDFDGPLPQGVESIVFWESLTSLGVDAEFDGDVIEEEDED